MKKTTLKAGRLKAELYLGDALAFLSNRRAGSADLLVSSPPYFIGKEYDRSDSARHFHAEHLRIIDAAVRAIKDGGSICWQVGYHVKKNETLPLDYIVFDVAKEFPELKLRNRITWQFGHGTHSARRFSGRHETIMWFTKGDDYYFDLGAVRVPQKYPGKRHYKGPKRGEWSGNPLGKNPEDVWAIPNVNANHVEKTSHPCQFPVALVSRLVRALTPPGSTVIDPYMGVGSSAIAALQAGRQFAGSEINAVYEREAIDRVRKFARGTLRVRADEPIFVPDATQAVVQTPPHFANGTGNGSST